MKQTQLDLGDAEQRARVALGKCRGSETLYVTRMMETNRPFVGVRRYDAVEVETRFRFLFEVSEADARRLVGLGIVHDRSLNEEFS